MTPTPIIQGRPEFGNPEHIKAVKLAAAKEAWKELPKCERCNGSQEVECFSCHHSAACEDCEGWGRERNAVEKWTKEHPGANAYEMAR